MPNTKQKRYFFLFLLTTLSGAYVSGVCLTTHAITANTPGQGMRVPGGENVVCIRLRDFPDNQEKRKNTLQMSKYLKKEIRKHKKLHKSLLEAYNTSARDAVLEEIIQNGKYLAAMQEQYKLAKLKNIPTI